MTSTVVTYPSMTSIEASDEMSRLYLLIFRLADRNENVCELQHRVESLRLYRWYIWDVAYGKRTFTSLNLGNNYDN